MEDYENQALPQSAFDAFGLAGREAGGANSFVSSTDEEKESAGRARVLQRRGRARVRELVKMAESMPAEAKRLSALETQSVTRATSVRALCDWRLVGSQQCGGFGSGQTSHGVHELAFIRRPPGLPWRKIVGKRSFLLSNLLAASKDGKRRLRLSRRALPGAVGSAWPWNCAGSLVHWRLCSPWSCSKLISDQENAVPQTFEFPGSERGWRPKLGDAVVPSDRYREKQNWRGRRHDQSRLKTMSVDGAGFREASATTASGQAFAQPELRRVLVAVPPPQVPMSRKARFFCSFPEGHKHLLLQGNLTQQSAKCPPRLVAFIAGLLVLIHDSSEIVLTLKL